MAIKAQFVRFTLVGITATLSTYAVLILLVEVFRLSPILASIIGYLVGIVVNYKLNYGFTFRSSNRHHILFPKFLIVMLVGLLLNVLIMFIGMNWLGIHYILSQLVAVAFVLTWSFVANRFWVFTD
ncbi:MAG: GtrA family protein [Gammaproteobacteria bacterium]|nr:GtrA family protein [Gammaproteobacteria bacterium]